MDDSIELRSYRCVFALERRIYRIDNLTLNPSGVPLRGIAYTIALALGIAVLAQLPLAGSLIRILPWWIRLLALPTGLGTVFTLIRIEGRVFHQAVASLLAFLVAPRTLYRFGCERAPALPRRWSPGEVVLLASGSLGGPLRLRYHGPGVALVRGLRHVQGRSRRLRVGASGRRSGKAIVVPHRGRLELEVGRD